MKKMPLFFIVFICVFILSACDSDVSDHNTDEHPFYQMVADFEERGIKLEVVSELQHTFRRSGLPYEHLTDIFEEMIYIVAFTNNNEVIQISADEIEIFAHAASIAFDYAYQNELLPITASVRFEGITGIWREDAELLAKQEPSFYFINELISLLEKHPVFETSANLIYHRAVKIKTFIDDENFEWLHDNGMQLFFDFDRIEDNFYNAQDAGDSVHLWSEVMFRTNDFVLSSKEPSQNLANVDIAAIAQAMLELSQMAYGVSFTSHLDNMVHQEMLVEKYRQLLLVQ